MPAWGSSPAMTTPTQQVWLCLRKQKNQRVRFTASRDDPAEAFGVPGDSDGDVGKSADAGPAFAPLHPVRPSGPAHPANRATFPEQPTPPRPAQYAFQEPSPT